MALACSSWIELLVWAGGPDLLSGARPGCVGPGLFGIFQSILLGCAHFRSLAEADRQVADMRERQAGIASLNDELRRQVGRRSIDILTALTATRGSTSVSLSPGEIIESRYRVLGQLGRGGMGTVYRVERVSDRRALALKDPQDVHGLALTRLAHEAQVATRVHHPDVVAIVDADVAQGGYAYLVMELVEGETLDDSCDARSLGCLAFRRISSIPATSSLASRTSTAPSDSSLLTIQATDAISRSWNAARAIYQAAKQ